MTKLLGSEGNVVELLIGGTAVQAGEVVVVGLLSGIAASNIAANTVGRVILHGVVKLKPRNNATTFTVGQKCYGRNSFNTINNANANQHSKFIGYALEASSNSSSSPINVLLDFEGENTT